MFCQEPLSNGSATVSLREKRSQSINKASEQRRDSIKTVPGPVVHQECRRTYCNSKKVAQSIRDYKKLGPISQMYVIAAISRADV